MLRDVVSNIRPRNDFDINERGLHMKRTFLALVLLVAATGVWAASPDRYLHVRVSNPTTHELVRVNVPLSLAERVIPAINHGDPYRIFRQMTSRMQPTKAATNDYYGW